MRRLISPISPVAMEALALLADRRTKADTYGKTFYRLGRLLAERFPEKQLGRNIMLVCTSEDADFLGRGMLDVINEWSAADPAHVAFACFWQARFPAVKSVGDDPGIDIAPVVKKYEELSDGAIDTLIVAKSIISSSCVVRHALLEVIGRKYPKRIFIAAPVILRGAQGRLKEEFPQEISRRFRFFFFAEDDQKDDHGNVLPGIGGSVYERLGIARQSQSFIPLIVKERRARPLR
jgi:hypothetical protein